VKKRSFLLCILILAAILSTACGTDSGETGIEVHQVSGNAAAQGENSEVYFEMHNYGSKAATQP